MAIRTVRLPYPHKGQQLVRQSARRFNWLSAGRRWRKTTLAMSIATEAALRGERWLWGAPIYKQVLVGWEEFERAVGGFADFHKVDQEIIFPTGGRVFLRSMDRPGNTRSLTADGVVLDEVGDISEEAFYGVIRPMLIDTGGPFWGIGTPRGRNWFWKEHQDAVNKEDSIAWQIPTVGCRINKYGELVRMPNSYENSHIRWEEIVNTFDKVPTDYFRQEIMAEFLKFGGSVFRNIKPNLSASKNAKPEDHEGHMLIMTVDWAKHNDWTVVDIGCGDCKVELEMDRFNQIDYTFQRDRIKALYDKWKPEIVVAEMNAMGEPNYELLWEDGIPVDGWTMSASNKPGLIRGLATALEKMEWKWLDDRQATFELEAFEQKTNPITGRSTYSAPSGANDDTVIARALMVHVEANMGHIPIAVT